MILQVDLIYPNTLPMKESLKECVGFMIPKSKSIRKGHFHKRSIKRRNNEEDGRELQWVHVYSNTIKKTL